MTNYATWDKAPVNPKKAFRIHLLVFLLTVPATWLVWYFTGRTYPWPIWTTVAWATGILFHWLGVYVFRKNKNISSNQTLKQ